MSKVVYSHNKRVSFSFLKALSSGVEYLKKYIERDKELESKSKDFGTASHVFFLEPKKFREEFCFLPESMVTPSSANQKEYCEYRIEGFSRDEAYEKCYKSGKDSEEKRKEKAMELDMKMNQYIQFMSEKKDVTILSDFDKYRIGVYKNKIDKHKGLSLLLSQDLKTFDVYNELEITFEYMGVVFVSKIDRLIIDKRNKKVYIIDIKTHSTKNISVNLRKSFSEAFFAYRYDVQMSLYNIAVSKFLLKNYPDLEDDMEYQTLIPVFQTNFLFQVKLIKITEDDLIEGVSTLNDWIKRYLKHEHTGFDFDIEYYDDDLGSEYLVYKKKLKKDVI